MSEDKTNQLPNSKVGVMVHYLTEGIKRDYNQKFDRDPISCSKRNNTGNNKKDNNNFILNWTLPLEKKYKQKDDYVEKSVDLMKKLNDFLGK